MVKKLQRVRQEQGLSLKNLADNIGVHLTSINYWEHGKRNPKSVNIMMLEEELGKPIDFLLEEDNDNDRTKHR